jgi:hypothetical protein
VIRLGDSRCGKRRRTRSSARTDKEYTTDSTTAATAKIVNTAMLPSISGATPKAHDSGSVVFVAFMLPIDGICLAKTTGLAWDEVKYVQRRHTQQTNKHTCRQIQVMIFVVSVPFIICFPFFDQTTFL